MRRFWEKTDVVAGATGFEVTLDGRRVKTPAKAALVLPSAEMADAVAAEWAAQDEKVDPRTMPVTRSANAAIDRVVPQLPEVAAMLAAYGDSDLLCYRADGPDALIQRQAEAWDPLLAWAAETYGAPLQPRTGVMHVRQDADALARLAGAVAALGPFELTGFHDLVSLSGSLVLALAVSDGRLDAQTAWRLSRIDEDWQAELWGADEEAEAVAARKEAEFMHAKRFLDLARAA